MESFRDSNANEVSMSDSFSLYERYLRSFNVVDSFVDNRDPGPATNCEYENSNEGNVDLSVNKHYETTEGACNSTHQLKNVVAKVSSALDTDCVKIEDTNNSSLAASSLDNSSATNTTAEHSLLTNNNIDVLVSSEDFKSNSFKQPVFITSTMENSNNAVDSVPMFRDTRPNESVFKLPTRELSFNGTLKHVQKLKPIVDPITALSSSSGLVHLEDKSLDQCNEEHNQIETTDSSNSNNATDSDQKPCSEKLTDTSNPSSDINRIEKTNESTGDSQYEEFSEQKQPVANEDNSAKWNSEQSYSSLEASFDSGVRSPDMFSDGENEPEPVEEPFWSFLKDFGAHDKRKLRKLEENLQGILPPPSVTTLKIDVTEMLKKYYCFLPAFTDNVKVIPEVNSSTPTKRVSFIQIPTDSEDTVSKDTVDKTTTEEMKSGLTESEGRPNSVLDKEIKPDLDTSADKTVELKTCTEAEARETAWPEVLKCRHYDVHYNLTQYSEKLELLSLRYGERYVGAETDSTVNVHSGGFQSPSSANKRKAMRLKMAAAKSPGRRLSHLARRRQAFCSAATIGEKAHASHSKMVLIDKNFFPHRKLINSGERKSPRVRRTPGKKTPTRKTPGKKTPKSSSTKKKAMRRLLMDSENITRSQPREIKRALFISPENRKIPPAPSTSVPNQAMKSRRALFGSPVTADTKSEDGTRSDQFLKRKRDLLDESGDNGRSKIAKSLSFGGDSIGTQSSQPHAFNRRASEMFATRNNIELDETRKKKLLWAVSEALRVHGWRMSSPGFREKASSLARLTRKLLALPPHAARLNAPKASTSETMLKLARQYVFAIIQGRSVEDCYLEEQLKVSADTTKLTGYISATAYHQIKAKQASTSTFVPFASQVKENNGTIKHELPRSASKNILQDKLVNIDTNSNSSSGMSMIDKVPLFKSNSMPSFEEAAKMRARRQISFDNVEFPKR